MARRLGFDAVRALRNSTGLGNYARGVLRGLRAAAPDDTFLLYSSRSAAPEFATFAASVRAEVRRGPGGTMGSAWWRTFRAGRQAAHDGIGLYHGLSHQLPRDLPGTGVRSVVTFHDLIYERAPELFPAPDRLSYRWRYRWSARHADAIVAVSSSTRDDLVEWYGIDHSRIAVVPPACDPAFAIPVALADAASTRKRLAIPDQYLLSVGTLERRKNHAVLLAAIALLPASTPTLLLIGRDGGQRAKLAREIERLGLTGRVRILDNVPTSDLPALMQGALLFLYPSRLEGFGMPIVEAMAAGRAVVAADVASLRDAAGRAAVVADPVHPSSWAAAIAALLADPAARAQRQALSRAHAACFDEVALARQLESIYDAVMAGIPLPARTLATEVAVETTH
ncbi:MAG TPA: glycosyltransferase family 1 protein [Gemmatimonadales bacterium]|jgi:glycosyltransferase involved in cell wall biosynthesis